MLRGQTQVSPPLPHPTGRGPRFSCEKQFVWLGNQWVSAHGPGHPRNRDLLYFALLSFGADGSIQHLKRQDEIHLSLRG